MGFAISFKAVLYLVTLNYFRVFYIVYCFSSSFRFMKIISFLNRFLICSISYSDNIMEFMVYVFAQSIAWTKLLSSSFRLCNREIISFLKFLFSDVALIILFVY